MGHQRKQTSGRATGPRKSLDHVRVDQQRRVFRDVVVDGRTRTVMTSWVARPVRRRRARPRAKIRWTVKQILGWADGHYKRNGRWPAITSGVVEAGSDVTWVKIQKALVHGLHGLPGGDSLAKFLARHRGRRNKADLPRLSERRILAWADAHHERTGQWPTSKSGPIPESDGDAWSTVDSALYFGTRGLAGGGSLARLLLKHRGVKKHHRTPRRPPLSRFQILRWADACYDRTGRWPTRDSGRVAGGTDTWTALDIALKHGRRGLPGGSSLSKLIAEYRGVRNQNSIPRLNVKTILAWADEHRRRTGFWPRETSGDIAGAPGEKWSAVQAALRAGQRGLPGGSSLLKLLAEHRGARYETRSPRLSEDRILAWADAHQNRTGQWPRITSGAIVGAPGEKWSAVNHALRAGCRGLEGGSSLARLLYERRGARSMRPLPQLRLQQILAWADAHYARTRSWPTSKSGPICEAPDETWAGIDQALRVGGRGLPPGSLARLLAKRRGVRNRKALPHLTIRRILRWCDSYHRRAGEWPNLHSGPVATAPGETWNAVDSAMKKGYRGLPGGDSLARLLDRWRRGLPRKRG